MNSPPPMPADETPLLSRPHPARGEDPEGFQAARTLIEGEAKAVHFIASGGSRAPRVFAPGTRLGPYEVIRELGRGSMGTVLAARHVELGREAALKVLSGALLADPES